MKWIVEDTLDETGAVKYDEERWRKLEREGWSPTSVWYQTMCKSFNNDSMKIAQELDVSFMGSSDNVVAPEFIEQQNKLNVREPLDDFKDPLVEETWFWKKPIEGHRYICACLPQGEKVLTNRGLVNVEDVKSDDLLVTKEGEFTKIKHRKYREVKDEEVVEILPYGCVRPTRFTWNHPIWVSHDNTSTSSEWKHDFNFSDATNVKPNDWLMFPNVYASRELSHDEMVDIWSKYETKRNNQYKDCDFPLENELFWWYCGIWLAEGYIHTKSNGGKRITTTHNINENIIHEKILKFAKMF